MHTICIIDELIEKTDTRLKSGCQICPACKGGIPWLMDLLAVLKTNDHKYQPKFYDFLLELTRYIQVLGACAKSAEIGEHAFRAIAEDKKELGFHIETGLCRHSPSEKATLPCPIDDTKAKSWEIKFLLYQHPAECYKCYKMGDCKLAERAVQNLSDFTDPYYLENIPKLEFTETQIYDDVYYRNDKCIFCSKCIEFNNTFLIKNKLEYEVKNNKASIKRNGNVEQHDFSLSLVDACLTGAMYSKKHGPLKPLWLAQKTATICTDCPKECPMYVWTYKDKIIYSALSGPQKPLCNKKKQNFRKFS